MQMQRVCITTSRGNEEGNAQNNVTQLLPDITRSDHTSTNIGSQDTYNKVECKIGIKILPL